MQTFFCINHYELIRKYECFDCGAVMMCACDEVIGRKFLPHQLDCGKRLDTQERVPVTSGFVENACNECRGLPVEAHPVASIPGRTSKIKRYYWREFAFREKELFEQYGGKPENYIYEIGESESEIVQRAKKQALLDIKTLHEREKKYTYQEESTESVLDKCNVSIRNVYAEYVRDSSEKAKIRYGDELLTVERYARKIYETDGYSVLFLESVPFHVIFSVFTWLVIQDSDDAQVSMSGFGERGAYEADRSKNPIWVPLPSDFGTSGYMTRRAPQINEHFKTLLEGEEDLLWLFEYWLPYSEGLRQYLWAYREEDIQTARTVVGLLPAATIVAIVKYLIGNYWRRYLGWPDLLVYNESGYFFAEVKSSKDKLSEEQKGWVLDNHNKLQLSFEILKIHRATAQQNHAADRHSATLHGGG